MTDNELDEMLNKWTAPSAPPSLRARVRAGFPSRPKWTLRWRRSLIAAAVFAAVAFFLIVTQASPQPPAAVPWTVDSQYLRYAVDGSSSIEMYTTSWESNSNEILLSRSMPGNPLKSVLGEALDVTLPALGRFHNHVMGAVNPGMMERIDQARRSRPPGIGFITGCDSDCLLLEHNGFAKNPAGAGCTDQAIVDRATILNYPTEAVRTRWTEHGRMTLWMAPALGCFALKVTQEEERPDGTFRLVAAKQALKVNVPAK